MRKFSTIFGVFTVVTALILGSAPARAATLTWEDPVGDAAPLGVPVGPLSEPAYDITKVTMQSDGTTLVWTAQVPGVTAEPPPKATGMHFTFSFAYEGVSYRWVVKNDRISGGGTVFYAAGSAGSTAVDCGKCIGKIDVEGKQVTLTAPIASMDRGIEGKFGAGSTMETVTAAAGRYYDVGVRYFPTDEAAAAPDPATFTV